MLSVAKLVPQSRELMQASNRRQAIDGCGRKRAADRPRGGRAISSPEPRSRPGCFMATSPKDLTQLAAGRRLSFAATSQ